MKELFVIFYGLILQNKENLALDLLLEVQDSIGVKILVKNSIIKII